jgi:hypothetical protein
MLFRILILFFSLILVTKAEEIPDYLLYDTPMGDDFDADLLERKVKKMERRLRDLEEDKD